MRTHADRGQRGERTLRTSASWYFSLLFQHALKTLSLWMMPIKVQIVIHLIRFAPQSIIWAGNKAYIQLTQAEVVNYMTHISTQVPHGVGVKCPDEHKEQLILTAPAITLSDHGQCMMLNADVRGGGEGWS